MADDRFYFIASDISISEQESNDLFLYIGMRMFSTKPNGNDEGVTEAFIDSIIENREMYNCLPLYVDTDSLVNGRYHSLGHMYNRETGEFLTTQIGGITEFRKVQDEYGISLYGQARVPKREQEICRAILDLYALKCLNFSFEIKYVPENTVVINGVRFVDASPKNILTGMAIVTVPACREAVALNLVAEQNTTEEIVSEAEEDAKADTAQENAPTAENSMDAILIEQEPPCLERIGIMNLEEAMNALAEKDAEIKRLSDELEQLKNTAVAEEKPVEETEEEKAAKEKEQEEMKASLEEKEREIESLRNELTGLQEMKAEYDRMKAEAQEAELKAKQAKAKAFAEMQGLDIEQEKVSTAIAELNYEMLASISMETKDSDNGKNELSYSMVSEIEIKDEYGNLLDRA